MQKLKKEDLCNFRRVYFISGDEIVYGMVYEGSIYTNECSHISIDTLVNIYSSPHYYAPNEESILKHIIDVNFNINLTVEKIRLHKDKGFIINERVYLCLKCGKESKVREDIDYGGIILTWDECCG